MKAPVRRCAIYTRKSSEEGLDQEFNSLDAQREAGEAYVKSQASEGWRTTPERYDDGGFSGGSMERPGLKRLMLDVAAGKIDVVVVYKIDRLTRSLADFARIVELFDRHSVSFVSVTQSFNTTSSMGRLTLNVLLSFAQFEREVTGERIRDKIAASKAKGMWMGGVLPLGYDLPIDSKRTLVVNEAEADSVRSIFREYLALKSVHALERSLDDRGIRSKRRETRDGRSLGGQRFSRGALFHLLRNRTYLGQIVHGDLVHPGNHVAIVGQTLFDAAQVQLEAGRVRRGPAARAVRAQLTGRIFDCDGHPMSPTFSIGAQGKSYRYYVSAPLQQGRSNSRNEDVRRISANRIEALLADVVRRLSPSVEEHPLRSILRIGVQRRSLIVSLAVAEFPSIAARLEEGERVERDADDRSRWRLTIPTFQHRSQTIIAATSKDTVRHDKVMIKALRSAHVMLESDALGLPILDAAPDTPHQRRLLRAAFLAPDLQRMILAGRQHPSLNLERLTRGDIPICWIEQRDIFAV